MTGDVDEECSLLQIPPELVGTVHTSAVPKANSASFISSTMTVDDGCMYTATVPTDIVNGYPEGTVLQMLPNATLVTLPIKCLASANNSNVVTLKNSAFAAEAVASSDVLGSILTETPESCETPTTNVEGSISDIDLSFLSESVVTSAISDPKCLTENTVKELQGMIAEVSQNLLQNNLSISESNAKPAQELEQPNEDCAQENAPGDLVMIDVSKPIQLAQNSLIMVNGQKCVLQQDPQTGQVVAYPIKEQEKPKRRRGRPRKTSVELQQMTNESEQPQPEATPGILEVQSQSEEENEKGLLEVINDDGSLVRRSSRKRTKNNVLKDYETGNLQQVLGSDEEDPKLFVEQDEIGCRKKKTKGPGRPRKYPKTLNVEATSNSGNKRPRGRPKKIVNENEPSQAFLVQTADGQVLMMQVPLSSIPQNMTLQEMAEQIATKLNQSLNQSSATLSENVKGSPPKQLKTSIPGIVETDQPVESDDVAKSLVQDHSIGSTTNFLILNQQQPVSVENACQNVMKNASSIKIDSTDQVEEVVLEDTIDVNSLSGSGLNLIPGNILDEQNNLNSLNIAENSFCVNTSQTLETNSNMCNSKENIINPICTAISSEEMLVANFNQVPDIQSKSETSHLCVKNEISKENVDFQFFLPDGSGRTADVQNIQLEELLNCENSGVTEKEISFQDNSEKGNSDYATELMDDFAICSDRQFEINRIANFHSYYQTKDNFNCESVIESGSRNIVLPSADATESKETMQNSVLEVADIPPAEDNNSIHFIKTDTDSQNLDIFMPTKSVSPAESLMNSDQNTGENTSVIAVPVKASPSLLPAPSTGSKNCKACKSPFSNDEELLQHFKLKHPKCICPECDYMAEHPYVIKRHSYRHSNQPCVCGICHKSYKDFYILKMHVKMVHMPPDVVYTCDICDKGFTRKAHLKRHMRTHESVKQFHCPHCPYQGCEKSDLNKHLLIHGDPKFSCEVCGKAFRHMKNRDLHVKRHSGQRDYKCGVCDFYGYTFTDIRKHIERRHKNAACKDCDTVFRNPEVLKEHKQSGTCPGNKQEGVKEEEREASEDSKEDTLPDEMPLEILDSDQVLTVTDCSEEALSALQNGHFVMTSDGMLNNQQGQFVLEDFEECSIITSEGLPVKSSDARKSITLVTADGRNLAFSLKNCSLPLEKMTASNELDPEISDQVVISTDIEIPP